MNPNLEKGEFVLSIDEAELERALEISSNPDLAKSKAEEIISSINNLADEYIDMSFSDVWEHNAKSADYKNAMQEFADNINKLFNQFNWDQIKSTDELIAKLWGLSGKNITNILDLYRKPDAHEWMQQKVQRVSNNNSYSKSAFWHVWSKRESQK